MREVMKFTCELSTISESPPMSNCLGHFLCRVVLKHLGWRRFPSFPRCSFSLFCLGLPLLLMTNVTSINSPSSPALHSSSVSFLPQNCQFFIWIKNLNVRQNKWILRPHRSSYLKSNGWMGEWINEWMSRWMNDPLVSGKLLCIGSHAKRHYLRWKI